jgi:tetratricopeptide (TPR) repeat protein
VPHVLALLLLASPVQASNTDVVTGTLLLEQGDAKGAIQRLERALADPDSLKAKNVPRAWRALGQARGQLAAAGDNALWPPTLEAYANCTDDAHVGEDCQELRTNASVRMLNAILDDQTKDAPVLAATLTRALPDAWLGPYAQAALAVQGEDLTLARQHIDEGWRRLAAGGEPSQPDRVFPLVNLRVSVITNIDGIEAGTAALEDGRAALLARAGDDDERASVTTGLAPLTKQLAAAANTLATLEAAAAAPTASTTDLIGWAQALDQVSRTVEAEAAWRGATERHPDDFDTWFGRGVHHYNRAAALSNTDPAAFLVQLNAAKAPFERAAALRPSDAKTLGTLVNICGMTGDEAGMATWQTQLDAQK